MVTTRTPASVIRAIASRERGWSTVTSPTPPVRSDRPSSAGSSASGPKPSSTRIWHDATRGTVAAKLRMLAASSAMKPFSGNGMKNSRWTGRDGSATIPSNGR